MITIIEGPKKSGKTTLANSLRNRHIGQTEPFAGQEDWKPHGSLLLDEDTEGEPRHLIEKLLHGGALPADGAPVKAASLNWKAEPSVVIVGKKQEKLLDEFEKLVPGFKVKVGPVKRLKLSDA
jgi:hypothetical protein